MAATAVRADSIRTAIPEDSSEKYPGAPSSPWRDRITRRLLIAIGIYTGVLITLLNMVVLGAGTTHDRAAILMGDGLILFWVVIGGSLTPMLRRKLVPRVAAIPIDWRLRFVLFSRFPSSCSPDPSRCCENGWGLSSCQGYDLVPRPGPARSPSS